jgi:hypothetical protein
MFPLTACPEPTCDTAAEVIDRYTLPSTAGPVEMVRTYCVARHIFTLPASCLKPRRPVTGPVLVVDI